ncbi:unnamed protein product [Ilex paraguariensis]|uniref:Uncharacterized protein n=1 Tax=Ilex paraguariensis TaxID=185542 RepID=A0ABC8U4R7_9AQUA
MPPKNSRKKGMGQERFVRNFIDLVLDPTSRSFPELVRRQTAMKKRKATTEPSTDEARGTQIWKTQMRAHGRDIHSRGLTVDDVDVVTKRPSRLHSKKLRTRLMMKALRKMRRLQRNRFLCKKGWYFVVVEAKALADPRLFSKHVVTIPSP